ncbi:MAG: hypothetical protein HXS48_09505 [Theionarchaea archaeon]|nr:hypothetical protein [Theionarchaea archaeon]
MIKTRKPTLTLLIVCIGFSTIYFAGSEEIENNTIHMINHITPAFLQDDKEWVEISIFCQCCPQPWGRDENIQSFFEERGITVYDITIRSRGGVCEACTCLSYEIKEILIDKKDKDKVSEILSELKAIEEKKFYEAEQLTTYLESLIRECENLGIDTEYKELLLSLSGSLPFLGNEEYKEAVDLCSIAVRSLEEKKKNFLKAKELEEKIENAEKEIKNSKGFLINTSEAESEIAKARNELEKHNFEEAQNHVEKALEDISRQKRLRNYMYLSAGAVVGIFIILTIYKRRGYKFLILLLLAIFVLIILSGVPFAKISDHAEIEPEDIPKTPGVSAVHWAVQKISTHVNNRETDDYFPQIATDASGNSYVVWHGSNRHGLVIYWVKIDSSGILGTIKEISTHEDNKMWYSSYPQIAVDPSGNSYVTWYGWDGHDKEIYWVKVDSSGVPGTVLKISTHEDNTEEDDYYPQIAVDAAGNSYVVWHGCDGNYEVYWVKIDSKGVPGAVLKISTHEDNKQRDDFNPQIAADASGNSYVTWRSIDGRSNGVYWVKIDSKGIPGSIVQISMHHAEYMEKTDYHPQIVADALGNSYVTWRGDDGHNKHIYWAKTDPKGIPGTILKISTHEDNTGKYNGDPQIAADAAGNSYVTWYGRNGPDLETYWVKIDSKGVPGTVLKISTHEDNIEGYDFNPQIAADAAGNSYVTWYGRNGPDLEIYWVKIDSKGVPGTVLKISTHEDNKGNDDRRPQIAVDHSGISHVVWWGYDGNDHEIYLSSIGVTQERFFGGFISFLFPV